MKKKILIGSIIAVVILVLVSIAPSINANVSKSSLEPVPDLDCEGSFSWSDIEPGATVTGTFTVINIGEPLSELDWEIESYPDLGNWTFCPEYGVGLTPESGAITIEVEFVISELPEDDFHGEIKIVNLENSSDYCIIEVFLKGKSIDDATSLEFEFQRIRELVRSIDLRKIIVNPDAVLETLEEISSKLEEEDVRDYIEKSSEEACGCEEDSSEFEWFFPVICTLLFPIWFVVIFIFFSSHRMFGALLAETMAQIGHDLNCFWKLG